MDSKNFSHLEANLLRASAEKSVFQKKNYVEKFLGFDHGNYKYWLEERILPNTRLIIEPKIKGCGISLKYEKGYLKNAITKNGSFNKILMTQVQNIPKKIPILKTLIIRGIIYNNKAMQMNSGTFYLENLLNKSSLKATSISFISFQIVNTDLNHYSQLKELSKLGFDIPPNEYTRVSTNEVEVFIALWKDKKIFYEVPNNGIVLKVNSRKLQKLLGENNYYPYWAYAVKR